MNAFANHFRFEFRTGIRSMTLLLLTYLIPLGLSLTLGVALIGIDPALGAMFIPLMTVVAILLATLMGLPDPLVTAREAGILRNYKINGVPTLSLLMIPALTTILHIVITTMILIVAAPLLFAASIPVNWLGFVVTFVATAFALSGLGVLIGVISASSRVAVMWSQAIFIPTMVVMWVPASVMPDAVNRVAQLLPPTHAINAFRGLAMGLPTEFSALGSLLILATGGMLAFGLAIYLFSWDRRNETRRGHPALAVLALLPYVIGAIVA
jgi:ABC-2 type transport system permease protein